MNHLTVYTYRRSWNRPRPAHRPVSLSEKPGTVFSSLVSAQRLVIGLEGVDVFHCHHKMDGTIAV